ncbi:MAG: phenylalanine--tRNA ligase subunit beta [Bacteroidales bacterium]|nr:phenylalanine--tRNA ligase subunit beta [Bacteroidales bacterium]
MKISYQWLKQYLPVDCTPDEISGILTSIGLEVEGLERFETVKGGLKGLVVGYVLTCEKHPDSDHLSKTTVEVGEGKILPIVCGAPNVAAGQKVIVATVGTTLYSGDEEFVIKKAKIRGEVSEGMICAEDEIGLGTSHDGIMVLDPDAVPGTPAADYFNISSDDVFEIGLTPNRIDSASHYGVARDLFAYFKAHGKAVTLQSPFKNIPVPAGTGSGIPVFVDDSNACRNYCGLTIRGIKVGPSPDWLKRALMSVGMHSINNVVDISNFILQETGQPLHIFDADAITGNKVIVKTLPEGTPFTTLDGEKRSLSSEDLMICNGEAPMCIAGVYGGLDSGVTGSTQNIFIESAYFNPVMIRKTARRHGLNTDASFRFERGIDPNMQVPALCRAADLVLELAGGTVCGDLVRVSSGKVDPFEVSFNADWFDGFAGKKIDRALIRTILEALEIEIVRENGAEWTLLVPPYRVDVTRDVDIAEELLRIYGYNAVEIGESVRSTLSYQSKPDKDKVVNLVSDFLSSQGFFETMSNSLTQEAPYEGSELFPASSLVRICNPLSVELSVLRQTLLFSGLETIINNINRKRTDLRIYEFGNTYRTEDESSAQPQPLKGYAESYQLGLWITGSDHEPNWISQSNPSSFFTLKSYVEAILNRLGIIPDNLQVESFSNEVFSDALRWGQGKNILAEGGVLRKALLNRYGIKNPVYYAWFDWNKVMKLLKKVTIQVVELPKFPEVRRDLALVLDQEVSFSQIQKLALRTEKKLLRQVSLFDVYQGDKIPEGKKSYAISFLLRDDEKTLQDIQIDGIMNKLLETFQKELGAALR